LPDWFTTFTASRYSCALADVSKRLAHARDFEREQHELSPSGCGIHWPLVDEDLVVDGLLRLAKPEPRESRAPQSPARPGNLMVVSDQHALYGTRKSRRALVVAESHCAYTAKRRKVGTRRRGG
jgi:hypothetical protein